MIPCIFLLLVLNGFCESAIFFVKESEHENEPVNLKLTKLLDIEVDSKVNTWKNDLSKLLHTDVEENNTEKIVHSLQVPLRLSFAIDKTNVLKEDEANYPDFNMGCKSLVGTSTLPLCRFRKKMDTKNVLPRSCREIQEQGNNQSGIYEIQPRLSIKPFAVLCDMETRGGGWTHIQKRFDGSQDFYLGWRDYKFGFGNLDGEFWMGLENIYHITGFEINELFIELTDRDHKTGYAQYTSFAIGAEKEGYPLSDIKGYTGDAGDAVTPHLGAKFTTLDVDQDELPELNCAQHHVGAWWYKKCYSSNLNGKYMNLVLSEAYKWDGLNWDGFRGSTYNLAGSRMLVRPIGG